MSLKWDPIQRAAWEAGNPDWLNAGTDNPDEVQHLNNEHSTINEDATYTITITDDATYTMSAPSGNGDMTLTWTLADGFVVHIDGQDIPVNLDREAMTARPARHP